MSLGRLLTAGKSLVTAGDAANRFRVNKRVVLPKFISPKNPFAPGAKAALTQPVSVTTASKKRVINETEHPRNCETGKQRPLPNSRLDEPSSRLETAWAIGRRAARAAQWVGELGQMFPPLPFLKRNAVSAKRSPVDLKPVQSELSLDRVKVVRNDLSDADLEVVTTNSKPGSHLTAIVAAEASARTGGALERLSSRLFGAATT